MEQGGELERPARGRDHHRGHGHGRRLELGVLGYCEGAAETRASILIIIIITGCVVMLICRHEYGKY